MGFRMPDPRPPRLHIPTGSGPLGMSGVNSNSTVAESYRREFAMKRPTGTGLIGQTGNMPGRFLEPLPSQSALSWLLSDVIPPLVGLVVGFIIGRNS